MNALVVSHMYPTDVTPMQGSFVHNQVRFLRGHVDARVVSPVPRWPLPRLGRWSVYRGVPAAEERDGVPVSRPRYVGVPKRWCAGWTWRAFARSLGPAMDRRPEIVHAHTAYPDGLATVRAARRRGIPVVITVHGYDMNVLPEIDATWRRRVSDALRQADGVIAVSDDLGARARSLGADPARLVRIPNGVDAQAFDRRPVRSPGEDGWRLLYTGRLHPVKGLDDLLHALAILRQRRQDVRLDLLGGGPHTGAAAPYQALAQQLGLQDCVRFLPAVPWDQVPAHLAQADVFVLPSHSEGLPLSLLEALASGLPVVATRCGGPTEVVDKDCGRLVDVGDREALANALDAVLDGYAGFDRDAIRARALADYDYRHVAARLHDFYRQTLASRPPRR